MARKRKNERTDGRIQLSVVTGHDEKGKLTRKYFYGYTRIEAQRKKDEYLQTVQAVKPRRLTVAQWIDEYREIYPSKANPLYKAQNDVPFKRLSAAIGNRMIDTIIEADLQKFMNTMGVYSASTIAKQIQVTKAVFAKARKNKLIPDDPSEYITPPTGTKGTHRALTRQEINQILEKWQSVGNAGLWVMVMLFAGLRRGEMMALNWDSVDMNEGTMTVQRVGVLYHNQMVVEERTKTRAGARIIPILRPLFEALSTIPPDRRNGLVCRSAQDKALSETAIRRGVQHFAHVTGVSFRCHDLRHTFCTLLYDSGTDVQTAAYLMGHSDVSVTMKIYTHLSEERKARSTVALTDYFSGLMMSE